MMLQLDFPMGFILYEIFIPAHLIFEILAFYCAITYYHRLRKSQSDIFSDSQRLSLLIAAAIGALFGSRLLAIIEHHDILFSSPSLVFLTQSKTIFGALVGGIISIETMKKLMGIKKSSGDLFVFPLLLGMIIGRVGCALSGVSDSTAGIASSLPWAYNQGDGIARHPTAIYEIIFLIMFWYFLSYIQERNALKNGDLFKFFMIGYALWRFIVEFIKPTTPLFMSLSAIQITAFLVLVYYFYIFKVRNFTK